MNKQHLIIVVFAVAVAVGVVAAVVSAQNQPWDRGMGQGGPGMGPGGPGMGPGGPGMGPGGPGMGPGMRPGMGPMGPMPPNADALDPDKDGKISRDEFVNAWANAAKEQFDRMDEDGDKMLSEEQSDMIKRQSNRPPRGNFPEGNMDGGGGPGNFQGPPPMPGDMGGPGGMPRFEPSEKELDADGDGKVTKEEYFKAWDTFNKARFEKIDTDGDGVLSQDERAKSHRGPRGGGGPGGPGGFGGPGGGPGGPGGFGGPPRNQ